MIRRMRKHKQNNCTKFPGCCIADAAAFLSDKAERAGHACMNLHVRRTYIERLSREMSDKAERAGHACMNLHVRRTYIERLSREMSDKAERAGYACIDLYSRANVHRAACREMSDKAVRKMLTWKKEMI